MADAAVKAKPAAEEERELTDGFHLIIDALKLNGLNTIYGVPGIPITDFGRMAQASGIRVVSFRHEQNAGYAAAIAAALPAFCSWRNEMTRMPAPCAMRPRSVIGMPGTP